MSSSGLSGEGGGGGGEDTATATQPQLYFCHQCNHTVTISPSPTSDLTCPTCNEGFLEELENPNPNPNPNPFFPNPFFILLLLPTFLYQARFPFYSLPPPLLPPPPSSTISPLSSDPTLTPTPVLLPLAHLPLPLPLPSMTLMLSTPLFSFRTTSKT